jgi:hypothetical protein
MKIHTITGHEMEIDDAEAKRIADYVRRNAEEPHTARESYAEKTAELTKDAMKELHEATGYRPKNLDELFEFAVEHDLFGDREETHIYFNFFKVMYGLLQKETHL